MYTCTYVYLAYAVVSNCNLIFPCYRSLSYSFVDAFITALTFLRVHSSRSRLFCLGVKPRHVVLLGFLVARSIRSTRCFIRLRLAAARSLFAVPSDSFCVLWPVAPHNGVEASLAGIVLATRIPTRGKSYRDTRCATEICDRVNDAGTAAI